MGVGTEGAPARVLGLPKRRRLARGMLPGRSRGKGRRRPHLDQPQRLFEHARHRPRALGPCWLLDRSPGDIKSNKRQSCFPLLSGDREGPGHQPSRGASWFCGNHCRFRELCQEALQRQGPGRDTGMCSRCSLQPARLAELPLRTLPRGGGEGNSGREGPGRLVHEAREGNFPSASLVGLLQQRRVPSHRNTEEEGGSLSMFTP